jgi:hypothetical protein
MSKTMNRFILIIILFSPHYLEAHWKADIFCENNRVTIGVDTTSYTGLPEADPFPSTCSISLSIKNNNWEYYNNDIRPSGFYEYVWYIVIKPGTNIENNSCVLSWDSSNFDSGSYQLFKDNDANPSTTILEDMTESNSYTVTGNDCIQTLRLVYSLTPEVSVIECTSNKRPTWHWEPAINGKLFRYKLDHSKYKIINDLQFTPPDDLSEGNHILYVQENYQYYNSEDEQFYSKWTPAGSATVYIDRTIPCCDGSVGKAIIFQGKRHDNEGLSAHKNTTDLAYKTLFSRGYSQYDVLYFRYDDNNPQWTPSVEGLMEAITQWAPERRNENSGNLLLMIVGHGNKDAIDVDNKIITSSDIQSWLSIMEQQLIDQNQKTIVVLGTCFSGSFIDDLSGMNRIIITSSSENELAFKGPGLLTEDRQGDFFVAEFMKYAGSGLSIRDSFQSAALITKIYTEAISDRYVSDYYDTSLQHPLLNDNDDDIGTNNLIYSLNGDGMISAEIYLGKTSQTRNSKKITAFPVTSQAVYLSENENKTSFEIDLAQVNIDHSEDYDFQIDIKFPNFSQSIQPEINESEHLEITDVYTREGVIEEGFVKWTDISVFSTPGTYQVLFYAREKSSHQFILLKETKVYKQKDNNTEPYPFSLVSPMDDIMPIYYYPKYIAIMTWENTRDPDGDRLSYTVSIAQNKMFVNAYRITGVIGNQVVVTFPDATVSENDLAFETTYYWKVEAIDSYGAMQSSNICQFRAKNPSGGGIGCVKALLQDERSRRVIRKGKISPVLNNIPFWNTYTKNQTGYITIIAASGGHSIKISAQGYDDEEMIITIPESCILQSVVDKKDIVLSRLYQLSDVITILQMLTRMSPLSNDLNKTNLGQAIDIGDAVLILKQVAEY